MSFRIENKYRVNLNKISLLYDWIKKNDGKKIFPDRIVNSIYFDNNKLSSYNNSIEGVVPRKKIRFRYYNSELKDNKFVMVEKKINSIEGRFKTSEKLSNFKTFLNNGYFDNEYGLCFPKTLVKYKREYFNLFKLRVTFDTNIKYCLYSKINKKIKFEDEDSIIFEVKSNQSFENYINENFHLEKIRFSKYCNSIEKFKIDY